jgi:hypothetical protein
MVKDSSITITHYPFSFKFPGFQVSYTDSVLSNGARHIGH